MTDPVKLKFDPGLDPGPEYVAFYIDRDSLKKNTFGPGWQRKQK